MQLRKHATVDLVDQTRLPPTYFDEDHHNPHHDRHEDDKNGGTDRWLGEPETIEHAGSLKKQDLDNIAQKRVPPQEADLANPPVFRGYAPPDRVQKDECEDRHVDLGRVALRACPRDGNIPEPQHDDQRPRVRDPVDIGEIPSPNPEPDHARADEREVVDGPTGGVEHDASGKHG